MNPQCRCAFIRAVLLDFNRAQNGACAQFGVMSRGPAGRGPDGSGHHRARRLPKAGAGERRAARRAAPVKAGIEPAAAPLRPGLALSPLEAARHLTWRCKPARASLPLRGSRRLSQAATAAAG